MVIMVKGGNRNRRKLYMYLGKQAKCGRAMDATGTFLDTYRGAGPSVGGADR